MNDFINYNMNYKWLSAEDAYDLLLNSEAGLRLTTSYDWVYPQFYKDSAGSITEAYPEDREEAWGTKDGFMADNKDKTFRIMS